MSFKEFLNKNRWAILLTVGVIVTVLLFCGGCLVIGMRAALGLGDDAVDDAEGQKILRRHA